MSRADQLWHCSSELAYSLSTSKISHKIAFKIVDFKIVHEPQNPFSRLESIASRKKAFHKVQELQNRISAPEILDFKILNVRRAPRARETLGEWLEEKRGREGISAESVETRRLSEITRYVSRACHDTTRYD